MVKYERLKRIASVPQYNMYNVPYFTPLYAYFHTFGGIFKHMADIRLQRFIWECRFRILCFRGSTINILFVFAYNRFIK